MSYRRILGLSFALTVATWLAVYGQQVSVPTRPKLGQPEEKRTNPTLRVDSNLVLVPVSVCDPMNRPVTGLEREHFKLFDDKVEQHVTHFAMDDEPVAVGLV